MFYQFFFKDDRMEMCVTMKSLKTTCYIPINKLNSFAHEFCNPLSKTNMIQVNKIHKRRIVLYSEKRNFQCTS